MSAIEWRPGWKRCRSCGELKPLDDYHRHAGRRDGHDSRCKACACAMKRAEYAADPEKQRERDREWREANPEASAESQRSYEAANRDQRNEAARERHAANDSRDLPVGSRRPEPEGRRQGQRREGRVTG